MSDRDEWGPWVEHDDSGVPAALIGKYIGAESERYAGQIISAEAVLTAQAAIKWAICWEGGGYKHGRLCARVVRYRIRKPRALIQLREMIETLPAPSRQKEDAHV